MGRILVVEDEPAILRGLADNLRREQHEVFTAEDGDEGYRLVTEKRPDLVILDLMLPKLSGYEVCRKMRAEGMTMPILILTARGDETDRVLGLDLGADDYIVKPFSVREVMARIKAVLRRGPADEDPGASEGVLHARGGLRLDSERYEATVEGIPLSLTPLEFELLLMFLRHQGQVLARERLLQQAWGYDFAGDTRAVDSAVKRLRAKLRAASVDADVIEAVRGIGYRFNG